MGPFLGEDAMSESLLDILDAMSLDAMTPWFLGILGALTPSALATLWLIWRSRGFPYSEDD
jgi:hypothetical protein